MKIVNLIQGSAEWLKHRSEHFNASDAPAMLNCSPYQSRNELIAKLATGVTADIDNKTQEIFNKGHRYEALARPLAEQIIGEDLFPIVGTEGRLSASFDGLTLFHSMAFEHKTLNDELRGIMVDGCTGADLPKHHRVQMEQQHMISGCEKILFMASKWEKSAEETDYFVDFFDDDGVFCYREYYSLIEERHCWYTPDHALRQEIVQGWAQFAEDLKDYVPSEAKPAVVAGAVIDLPAVVAQVSGELAIKNNFAEFGAALNDFVDNRLIKKPQTDQDFADLEAQIKTLKKAEDALSAAGNAALAQVATLDEMMRMKDALHKLARDNRLAAEKIIKMEKENRKAELIMQRKAAFAEHIAGLQADIPVTLPVINADFAGAIKGKSSISSIENSLDSELAKAKIEANRISGVIRKNCESIPDKYRFLFADLQQIAAKDSADFNNLVALRISQHEAAEQERMAQEKAAAERREAEQKAALERAERDKAEAIERQKQAEQQAEIERQRHKEIAEQAAIAATERAKQAEIDRQAQEHARIEVERKAREENAAYASNIEAEVFADLTSWGVDNTTAKTLVEKIKAGAIRHISIVY